MFSRRPLRLRFIGVLVAAGFATGAVSPVDGQVVDSAGITLVENPAPLWSDGEAWTITPEPELTIGGWDASGAQAIFSVAKFTRLSDGSVAVLQWNRNLFEVRIFEPDGSHRVTFGRSGEGPFEVGRNAPISFRRLPGDSLEVVSGDNRVSVFGPNGEQVRSVRLDHGESLFPFSGWVGDQRYLTYEVTTHDDDDGWTDGRTIFLSRRLGSSSADTLASFESAGGWSRMNQGAFPEPFGARVVHAVGPDRIWLGRSHRYEIEAWDPGGARASILRHRANPPEVTGALRRRYRDWQADRYSDADPALRQGLARYHRIIRFPSHLPAYHDLRVDSEGFLWVLRYELPWVQSDLVWDVHTPTGQWLGPVAMPFEMLPGCRREIGCHEFEIGRDYILVRDRDEFDAFQLKIYRLRREF